MSSGVVHERIALLVEAGLLSSLALLPLEMSIGLLAGGVVGVLITPDIDHHATTREESRWYNRSIVLGRAWQIFWSPYPILFRHRGWSHTPVIGTLTRALLIFVQVYILSLVVYTTTGYDISSYSSMVSDVPLQVWEGLAVGWILQDIVHWATDSVTGHRR
jgi:uncharacterized metal-binding protein